MSGFNANPRSYEVSRSTTALRGLGALSVLILGLAAILRLPEKTTEACQPSIPPTSCRKSVNLVKAFPFVILPPVGATAIFIPVRINTDSGPTPPFNNCPSAASVTGGTVTVTLICVPPATATGTAPLPARPSGLQTGLVFVPVVLPAGFVGGFCAVVASVDANFSADNNNPPVTLTASGDTVLCLVEESPDMPGVPRLNMVVESSTGTPLCGAGVQTKTRIILTNNDATNSVSLIFEAESRQRARMPSSPGGAADGTYSISTPDIADDFPLAFAEDCPASGILPLPSSPSSYIQRTISKSINIAAGDSLVVEVVSTSYLMCSNGSCAEKTFTVTGEFSNGDPVVACVGDTVTLLDESDCPDAEFATGCCFGDGGCQTLLPSDCKTLGGTTLGAYADCQGDNNPPNPDDDACDGTVSAVQEQACCLNTEGCQTMLPIDCSNLGGTPQGIGQTCEFADCPAIGACCFSDGTCQELFSPMCASVGGVYQGDETRCGGPPLPVFIDVLLGLDDDPFRVVLSDKNEDFIVDGRDIEPYVTEILMGNTVCE